MKVLLASICKVFLGIHLESVALWPGGTEKEFVGWFLRLLKIFKFMLVDIQKGSLHNPVLIVKAAERGQGEQIAQGLMVQGASIHPLLKGPRGLIK